MKVQCVQIYPKAMFDRVFRKISFITLMWIMTAALNAPAPLMLLYLLLVISPPSNMCIKALKILFCLIGFVLIGETAFAQKGDPFSCFNAQEIHFPIDRNDFSMSQILMNDRKLNALYYLYEDKYSFWYKFIADEDLEIQFSVAASNKEDRYRVVAFRYGGTDFCDRLINANMQPMDLQRAPIFTKDGSILYRNTIEALKGDTFYISVLSLNRDDCGHFLHMESKGEQLSIHAVHRPCYNFTMLEVPDFSAAKLIETDVEIDLDFEKKSLPIEEIEEATVEVPQDSSQFAALKSVEVQNKLEGIVSVGDRLVLNNVFFYNNTYALKPGGDQELDQLVAFLKANPTIEIEVQGHTANHTEEILPDPNFKGQGKEWNFKGSAFELSEERAKEVKEYLVDHGISKKRVKAVGYGDTHKRIPDAKTFEEFEKNMRVEALIIKE